jgi:hypothetical protein
VAGARESVEVQMASEKEAELSYRALKPLYFGASAEGIALRHLLPDIYEAWDEMCLAFRYMYICLIMIIMYEALSY